MVRGVPMRLDDALRCYDSIPFDATRRDQIVDLLTRAMQLYSFLDIAVAPPPPFEAVDLLAELATIRRTTFASDLRMHLAISDLFRKLRDAHTSYHVPACFQSPIYNALPLFGFAAADGTAKVGALNGMKVFEDTNPRLNFFRNVIQRTETVYANFSDRVEGATVLQIDGLNPWLALSAFARDSVGVAKSSETRLSLSLTRALPNSTALGAWTARSLFATGIPPAGTVVTLMEANATSPTVYKLPFFLVPSANVSSVDDLTDLCFPNVTMAALHEEVDSLQKHFEHLFGANPLPTHRPGDAQPRATPPNFKMVFSDNEYLTFWVGITDAGVTSLVMYMPSFSVKNMTLFADSLLAGFQAGANAGATQLIIDLTANGGGSICATTALLNITGLWVSEIYTDMPGGELANAMATAYVRSGLRGWPWSPNTYASDATGQPFVDESWLIPGVNRTRGGRTRAYSELMYLSDEACRGFDFPYPPLTGFFNASSVKIVTHGACGSACAMFVDHAAEYAHVETIVIGVHDPSQQQISSFPGGQVLEDKMVMHDIGLARLPLNLSFVPNPVSVGIGSWRVDVRELYGLDDHDTPLEFVWQTADRGILPTRDDAQVFGSYWSKL